MVELSTRGQGQGPEPGNEGSGDLIHPTGIPGNDLPVPATNPRTFYELTYSVWCKQQPKRRAHGVAATRHERGDDAAPI